MMRAVVFTLAVLSICCGGGTASSPTAIDLGERLTLRVQTAHFQIFGGTSPDTTLRGAANRLEAEYSRILGNLGVSSHPVVTVRIWQDAASYYNELTRYFGTRYQAGGYITGPTELRLLAGGNLDTDVVHEFVHAVSLDVDPTVWRQPALVVRRSRQRMKTAFVHPRLIESVVNGRFPTLQQLNADVNADTQIYQLGYVLGEFIVSRWGRPALIRLIETNADLPGVLGVSAAEFEAAWQSHVRQRYLS